MKVEIPRSKKLRLERGGAIWLSLREIKQLFALILLLSLAGCISLGKHTVPYPESWPAPAMLAVDQCPDIAGQYANEGGAVWDQSGESGWKCPLGRGEQVGNCDATLSNNLLQLKLTDTEYDVLRYVRPVDWLQIQQPDPDTLEVYFPPTSQFEPRILKRSKGDFDCDSSGLKFSASDNTLSTDRMSIGQKILFPLLLTGGAWSSVRVFRPLQDGSLSMEASASFWWTHLLWTFKLKWNAFVRWERYQPLPMPTATADTPSSP